jgi:hypothetical protein
MNDDLMPGGWRGIPRCHALSYSLGRQYLNAECNRFWLYIASGKYGILHMLHRLTIPQMCFFIHERLHETLRRRVVARFPLRDILISSPAWRKLHHLAVPLEVVKLLGRSATNCFSLPRSTALFKRSFAIASLAIRSSCSIRPRSSFYLLDGPSADPPQRNASSNEVTPIRNPTVGSIALKFTPCSKALPLCVARQKIFSVR